MQNGTLDQILEQKEDIEKKKNSEIFMKSGVEITVVYPYQFLNFDKYATVVNLSVGLWELYYLCNIFVKLNLFLKVYLKNDCTL